MNDEFTVAFAGGGSAGHVIPNLTIANELGRYGARCIFLGRERSIESELVKGAGLPFFEIRSRGLNRYLTVKNFGIAPKLLLGILDSIRVFRKESPVVVFGKGGYVSLPPLIAAYLLGIPFLIHESDGSLGLANSIAAPFAERVCLSTPLVHLPKGVRPRKLVVTGNPIRNLEVEGRIPTRTGRRLILIFGGSQGSRSLNAATKDSLSQLLELGDVHHVTGQEINHVGEALGYFPYKYISDGFPSLLGKADLVVCRAGANTIAELLQLEIPAILVPLPTSSSRGDQWENAMTFKKRGCGLVIPDEKLSGSVLIEAVRTVLTSRQVFVDAIRESKPQDGTIRIVELILQIARSHSS